MNPQQKHFLIGIIIAVCILSAVYYAALVGAAPFISNGVLSDLGVDGMRIDSFKINDKEIKSVNYKNSDFELDNVFIKKSKGVEQDIYLKNKGDIDKSYQMITIIEIDYSEVIWNGQIYKLTSIPVAFYPYYEEGKFLVPNIFMGKENKRINFRDLGEKGGYARAYESLGKYYIELRMDNLFVKSKQTRYVDPVYVNATDGFSTIAAGASNPTGIAFNGSSLWLVDFTDKFVYHFNTDGTNITNGFSVSGQVDQPQGIATDGINFWAAERTGQIEHYIYPTFSDQIAVMSGAINLRGITNNDTFLWTVDDADARVYSQDFNGDNEGSFDTASIGSDAPNDITTVDGTEFWIIDNTDNFVYHVSKTGANQTDGFSVAGGEATNPTALTTDGTSFWIADATDGFVYHYVLDVDLTPPTLTLIDPQNWTYNTSSIFFNITAVDGGGGVVSNCTFNFSSTGADYNMTEVSSISFNFTNSSIRDGHYDTTFICMDNETNIATEEVAFTIDAITIDVNLTLPLNDISLFSTSDNFIANYSFRGGNLTNSSYFIWYVSNGSIFNQTNFSFGGTTNSTTLSLTNLIPSDFKWNVYSCGEGNFSECIWADNNFTFTVGLTVIEELWNNHTFETDSENFQINITLFPGTTLVSANLTYNGTNYPVSDISINGSDYVLSRTIDIPVTPSTFSDASYNFNWSFIFVDEAEAQTLQTTTLREQNATWIAINICNGTFDISNSSALNFTMFDEIRNTQINATQNNTDFEATFNFWKGSGDVIKNYSYNNLTSTVASNYSFCLSHWNETFQSNLTLQYDAVDFSPRTYFLRNATLDNTTNDIRLDLLDDDTAVKFFFDVKQNLISFPLATVVISKFIVGEGNYRTIGIRETDFNGQFIEYLELDETYQASISRSGVSFGVITFQAQCTESPCEKILNLEDVEFDLWGSYNETYASGVAYSLDYNDTTKMVTYVFTDVTGLAQSFSLDVFKSVTNETSGFAVEPSGTFCNKTSATTAGTITCNLTAYTKGNFRANAYVSRSPSKLVDFITVIISSIKDTLGQLGIFIAFMIIVTVAFVGIWNPAVGVVMTTFAVVMMWLIGFIAFSWTTIVLIIIMGGILVYKMKT